MRPNGSIPGPAWARALALVLCGLLWTGCPRSEEAAAPEESPTDAARSIIEDTTAADVYFPTTSGFLGVERRAMDLTGEPEDQVRLLVEALLAGPTQTGHERPFSEGVTLAGVYVADDGTAFVDLASEEALEPPSTGSMHEMQIVYSLVNTVTLNVPGVERVALLWNGRQRETFAGHLDTSVPLAPQTELVSR